MEFAIIASLLFMILFGIVQFGIAYNRYQGLQAAAREGARLGSLSQTTRTQIVDRVKQTVSLVDPNSFSSTCVTPTVGNGCIIITTSVTPPNADRPCNLNSGNTISVLTRYRMELPVPFWASPSINITGRGVFRCE